MKINAKQYAIALYEAAETADEKILKNILKNFIITLDKNGHLNLLNKIIEEYKVYFNIQKKLVDVTITTAHTIDDKTKEKIEKELKKYLNKKLVTEYIEDKKIIGGFIAQSPDYLIDASLKTQLNNLKGN